MHFNTCKYELLRVLSMTTARLVTYSDLKWRVKKVGYFE